MIVLSASDISLSFGTDVVLENVNIGIDEADKIGVVGVNGAGKSLFMKILCGKIEATSGNVFTSKDKTVGFLEQNTGLESDNEIFDEMCLAFSNLVSLEKRINELCVLMEQKTDENTHMSLAKEYTRLEEQFKNSGGYEYKSRIYSMLLGLGFEKHTHNMKINELSGGQKTRLAIARLLLSEPDVLCLDEPTNHLDMETCVWLENYLSGYKKALVVISHDRYFLDKVTNKTFEIENTQGKMYTCAYTEYVKRKEADRKADIKHFELQQKEIARLEAFIENQRKWNRERNIIAAESRMKAIDRMEKLDKPKDLPKNIKFKFEMAEDGKCYDRMLEVTNLSKAYPGKELFCDLSFILHGRDKMFILGKNGVGKSTLLKILCGKVFQDSGTFEYAKGLSIGYYDQEHQGLNENNTVIDELWNCFPDKTQTQIRSTLAGFQFTSDDVFKSISVLSGGEKARLTFAKLMLEKSDVLILDEPTNHLDAPSREVLEEALGDYDGTLLCVSHDRYFVNKLASRIMEMKHDSVFDFKGNYDDFCEYNKSKYAQKKQETNNSAVTETKGADDFEKSKQQRNLIRNQQRKLEQTEKKIEELEMSLEENAKMQNNLSGDYEKANKLFEEETKIREELSRLYELWEQLQS